MAAEQEIKQLSLQLTGIFCRLNTNKMTTGAAFEEVNMITDKMDRNMEVVNNNTRRLRLNNQDLHKQNYKLRENVVTLEAKILHLEKKVADLSKENSALRQENTSLQEWSSQEDASLLSVTEDVISSVDVSLTDTSQATVYTEDTPAPDDEADPKQ